MRLAVALFALFPMAAYADCGGAGNTMFHCTFKNGAKAGDLCINGDFIVTYRYGRDSAKPELELSHPADVVFMRPWPGVGRYIWEEATISNGDYSYTLHHSVDRLTEDAASDGGIIVRKGEEEIANLTCDAGTLMMADFYPLFLAKEDSGQTWCPSSDSWEAACKE